MKPSHIIFGGIGTLVETSEYQYQAYNTALMLNDIDYYWERKDYVASLSFSGGPLRLEKILMANGSRLTSEQIVNVHSDKTRVFNTLIRERGLKLREGADELIAFCLNRGVKLAWATTTRQDNIDAITDSLDNDLLVQSLVKITNSTFVENPKPNSEIYQKMMIYLDITEKDAIAIEDSPSGVKSSSDAGITTLAFPGEMNSGKDFSAAHMIISDLSEVVSYIE
ncbi:MAG: HAD-IA family hydrolase [Pseudomonadota bacterium]|nr:HAD-IA family hydrolase [Pseudomonadota bacterium]